MLEKGAYDPEQQSNSEVLLFLHKFYLAFVPQAILLIIPLTLPIIAFIILVNVYGWQAFLDKTVVTNIGPMFMYMIGIFAYLLIIVAIFFNAWVTFYFDVVIVTRTHLITVNQYGFFNRKIAEQSLLRVQDVSARTTGFWQTWFRYGTVFVETAGEAPNFIMPDLKNSQMVANTILKLHDELVATEYEEMAVEGEGDLRSPESHFMDKNNQPVFNTNAAKQAQDDLSEKNNIAQQKPFVTQSKEFSISNLESLKSTSQEIKLNEIGSFEEFNKNKAVEEEKKDSQPIKPEVSNSISFGQQQNQPQAEKEEGELEEGESIKL